MLKSHVAKGRASDSPMSAWQVFYQQYFNLDCDFSQLRIPKQGPSFKRLIIVAKGLTLGQVYDVCAKHFSCWRWTDDLDKDVSYNDRSSASGSYAIRVRDQQEADEELRDLSADQLKKKGTPGITLMERLLYELKYWDETGGEHLDVLNWTLCSGSRYSDGHVPCVDWNDNQLKVGWYYSSDRHGHLRCRAVVS